MRARTYFGLAFAVVCAGLAGRWSALNTGFIVDDFAQLSMVYGTYPVKRAPLELFTFSSGDVAENSALRASGFFPWWSDPELRISLFRPLASALMWCDRWAFGADPFRYHLHSALWWCAMLAMWAVVLARLLPPLPAFVALLLCVVHPAHVTLLGWIAGRNASVAGVFALLGLWVQLRSIRPLVAAGEAQGERAGLGLGLVSYAIALSASEYALGFIAYGVTYELCRGRAARRRVVSLAALLAGYLLLRRWLGFGTHGSGMYIDPGAEPMAFLRASLERLPVLAADLVFTLRSNWWTSGYPWNVNAPHAFLPSGWPMLRALHVAVGVLALLLAAVVAWLGQRSDRRLRFIALGLPLSIAPALGSLPEARLLLPALLGWSILLAQLLVGSWRARRVLLLLAVPCSAVLLVNGIYCSAQDSAVLPRFAQAVRTSILKPEVDRALAGVRRMLLVSAVDPTTTIYVPLLRHLYGRPLPEQCQLLLTTYERILFERTGERSFRLERQGTGFDPQDLYVRVFNRAPLRAGQQFDTAGMHVTVESEQGGALRSVRYELDVPLEDPSIAFMVQTDTGLARIAPPAEGTSQLLPPAVIPYKLMPP
jgi:hypothetical protein